jgi:hypothetical protein
VKLKHPVLTSFSSAVDSGIEMQNWEEWRKGTPWIVEVS